MNNTRECLQSLIDSKVWFVMEESATALARIGHAVEVIEILDPMRACHSCFHQGSYVHIGLGQGRGFGNGTVACNGKPSIGTLDGFRHLQHHLRGVEHDSSVERAIYDICIH